LEDTASVAEYFAEVRLSRQESRDSAVSTLQEVMSYETGADESAVTSAETALEQVVATALAEAQIESLLVAKGYSDCVAYMTDSGISIAVAAPEEGLNAESVAQIADIVTSQSDYELADIRVIEVN
jgi:stage III sporulation protein AH